ncbi:MAG: DNA double-strand break repair nuclease NurA [Nitrososphaeria archaeon]|jgi:hypothetical protein
MLPIDLAVQLLEKNVIPIPLGQPTFADRRYHPRDFDNANFHAIPKSDTERTICFIDGGNMEIASAPNFIIELTRLYFNLFKGNRRMEPCNIPQRIDFYTVCYATLEDRKIVYRTEFVPVKEIWRKYLPEVEDLKFNSFDRTIMSGLQRATIDKVSDAARTFAEWKFTNFIMQEELNRNDILVKDGTLQTSVTNESKYANEAYGTALNEEVYFTALSKTSTLFTTTGQPLLSAIWELSQSTSLKGSSWYYHPIVKIAHPDHRAEMFAVKLHKQSEHVFRFEILREQAEGSRTEENESIISALADNSKDVSFPGYPFGLMDADRLGRVDTNEKSTQEFQFKAVASKRGIWKKISQFTRSSDAHMILNELMR